ncbi:unnamed protein product [Leuciscus chuanchicus]
MRSSHDLQFSTSVNVNDSETHKDKPDVTIPVSPEPHPSSQRRSPERSDTTEHRNCIFNFNLHLLTMNRQMSGVTEDDQLKTEEKLKKRRREQNINMSSPDSTGDEH